MHHDLQPRSINVANIVAAAVPHMLYFRQVAEGSRILLVSALASELCFRRIASNASIPVHRGFHAMADNRHCMSECFRCRFHAQMDRKDERLIITEFGDSKT